ncbi:MAG: hypothetical protein ACSHW0_06480 [Thalassotalea sp.]
MANKINYLSKLEKQFYQHFTLVKKQTPDHDLKLRMQGYINAGQVLGVITSADAEAIMEQQHQVVFGESIEARKTAKQQFKNAVKTRDESFFELPAIERNGVNN